MSIAPSQANVVSRTVPNVPAGPIAAPHRVATGILLIYLFLVVSRGVELLVTILGINLHLALILMMVLLAAAVLTGGLLKVVGTPVVLMFTAFTGWFLLTILTSQWRGGSVATLWNFWLTSYACALLIPSLISSLDQCRKACYCLAFSLIPILLATVLYQSSVGDRDQVLFGTLGNPNDLAFSMLMLIPFAVFVIASESLRNWKAIACMFTILLALLKTLKTGSRAAMVTMAICSIILLFSGKMKTKLRMIGLASVILVIAVATVPSQTFQRYTTIFSGTSIDADMSVDEVSAVQSTTARKMLFQESFNLMLQHPLFGVGPGIFAAALAGDQKDRGVQESWHEAHNSYTQIGSEMGVIAFLVYVAILIYSLKRAASIYRGTRNDPTRIAIRRMAASLFMALMIFAICATFGNYSYTFHLPILAGLVQAFDVCVREEMNARPSAPVRLSLSSAALTPKPQVSTNVRHRRLRHNRA